MSTSKVSLVAVAAAANRLKTGAIPKQKRQPPQPKPQKIRVCVLSSSYDGSDSPTASFDDFTCSPQFWLGRDKEKYEFVDVQVKKANSFGHVRELIASGKYDVFYNLCDGAKDEKRAGVDVVNALEALNAAYTGGDSKGFEPNKVDMKVLVANANVRTPNFVLVDSAKDLAKKCRHLKFPVIVKHMSGYASVGITKDSKCETLQQLETQVRRSIKEFNHALVEEFISGREGTVLVCPDSKMPFGVRVFQPLMFNFLKNPADFNHFHTKWNGSLDDLAFMSTSDPAYKKVHSMARNAFTHIMNGVGYGRCDFRIDEKGEVYFLEINANCGMYYDPKALPNGDYADRMVTKEKSVDGYLYDDFIETQIQSSLKAQGIRAPWYCISHDAHGHFSTRASRNVPKGTPLFSDPTYPIPVVSKALYTLGEDDATVGCVICRGDGINSVVAIRHSCEPNMQFVHGRTLTFESSRSINKGEELTVDYGTLRDPKMPAFACSCGTTSCRSVVFSDQPTPRISQQRRKWERRERLLQIKKRKAHVLEKRNGALPHEKVLSDEGDLEPVAKSMVNGVGSLHIEPSLSLSEDGDSVVGALDSLGESMEELELLEEVKDLLTEDKEIIITTPDSAAIPANATESLGISDVATSAESSPVATPPSSPATAPFPEEKKKRAYKLQPPSESTSPPPSQNN